jgi:hypothetical protein
VSDAFSELESLGEECREIVENAEGGLAETQRVQTFGDTADALENLSEPEVPDCVTDLAFTYQEAVNKNKRRGPSRSVRRDNAVAVIRSAMDALQEWLDDEANAEHDDRDEVDTLQENLDSLCCDVEDLEFPGMFG